MNNSKHYSFKVPIYDEYIHVYFSKTIKDAIIDCNISKELVVEAKRGDYDCSAGIATSAGRSNKISAIVVFKDNIDRKTILHETVHLTFMILRWKGIHYNTKAIENEEPFAYLFEYIGDKLFNIWNKHLKEINYDKTRSSN